MMPVIEMATRAPLETLAARIRAAWTRLGEGHAAWVAGTLELIDALTEGRRAFPSDVLFGRWLVDQELDVIGKDDRAALLNIGAHRDLAQHALEESGLVSYQRIWREYLQPRLLNPTKADDLKPESAKPAITAPAAVVNANLVDAHTEADPEADRPIPKAWQGRPRAAEVAAIFKHPATRAVIGQLLREKKAGDEVWQLIVSSLEQGFLTPTQHLTVTKPSLRLVFPQAPRTYANRFDLTRAKDRHSVRAEILPAAMAHRDELRAQPHDLERIVREHQATEQDAVATAQAASKLAVAIGAMKPDEQEIMLFGVRFWPQVDPSVMYTYAQVCTAAWTVRDWHSWLRAETPASKAIYIRLATRWLYEYCKRENVGVPALCQVFGLISRIATALQQNPEGVCRYPISPKSADA